jgi:hypothetical protein
MRIAWSLIIVISISGLRCPAAPTDTQKVDTVSGRSDALNEADLKRPGDSVIDHQDILQNDSQPSDMIIEETLDEQDIVDHLGKALSTESVDFNSGTLSTAKVTSQTEITTSTLKTKVIDNKEELTPRVKTRVNNRKEFDDLWIVISIAIVIIVVLVITEVTIVLMKPDEVSVELIPLAWSPSSAAEIAYRYRTTHPQEFLAGHQTSQPSVHP